MTGIRTGEALGLRWADIDWSNNELHIRRAIYRGKEITPKTEGSKRSRPMIPALASALLNHKHMAHYIMQSDYVFANANGRPTNPDQLREVLHTTLKQIGIVSERH